MPENLVSRVVGNIEILQCVARDARSEFTVATGNEVKSVIYIYIYYYIALYIYYILLYSSIYIATE